MHRTNPQAIDVLSAGDLASRAARNVGAVTDEHGRSLLLITSAIADAVTAGEVYEAIVDHVAAALSASSCALWLREGNSLHLARQIGYASRSEAALRTIALDCDPSLPIVDAFRRREPIWIASQRLLLDAYPHIRGTTTEGRGYRVSCLPLTSDGSAVGVLGITLEEERESSTSERSFLLLVARYASQALERLRIVNAERRSRERADAVARRMTILSHASRAFTAPHVEHHQRLHNIVHEVGTLMGATATLALVRGGRLHGVAIHHPDPAAVAAGRTLVERFPLQAGEGIAGKVLQTGEPALLNDLDPAAFVQQIAEPYRSLFERFPMYAMMVAPLRVGGRILGTLTATRVRPGERFEQDDLELLEALADRAATAIEASRLHRAADEARRRAEQLYAFANAAVSAETLEQVFDAALTAVTEALQTPRAAILLFDDDDAMHFKAWRCLSDAYRAAVDGHSPWRRDEKAAAPVLVADCLRDPAWRKYEAVFRAEGIAALAFIPLVNRGQLLGKFMVYYGEPHVSDASDVELASTIASHLASMIARFRALAELERTLRDNELFAGVLAHDLRNPLSAIMTATQLALMQNEAIGERSAKPLSRILASTERMSNMITQLLDFTRARVGGGIEIHPVPMRLVDITKHAVAELELAYPERRFELAVRGDPRGTWDPDRLAQVISNLVGNASQHGDPESCVTIVVEGRADCAELSVHNAGAIPEALLPNLFEPFRSERRHGDRRGLGLGLYIVREIVRAHRGTVDVTSSEPDGTTFVVRLPRD